MSSWSQSISERVAAFAEPLIEAEGMELVDVEYLREGGRWVLRLFIDKPGGVSLEDCQTISRQVERVLDVEDPIETAYSLEVSSPGVARPLKKRDDFRRFAEREVEIRTFGPVGEPPRRNFKGRLLGIDEEDIIRVEIGGEVFELPWDQVAKAKLAVDFDELFKGTKDRTPKG